MRLGTSSLATLPHAVRRPGYDRSRVRPGIVHLGIGAFHRAHQSVYTDTALEAGDAGWGIVGASLRSPDTADALSPQDGLYTLAVRGPAGEDLRVIGSVQRVLVASDGPDALLDVMTRPGIRIVSLTVTEKGYCHEPSTGRLREDDPGILADLAAPRRPRTAPGILVEALARRRAAGLPPFTVLTCDNLPANGVTVHRVLSRYAALRDPELGRFIAGDLACPSTMVDRIVPATTDDDRQRISRRLGVTDAWPVTTEPFSQWVLEDRFPQGRPDWAAAGAVFSADVPGWEALKLRLLNGSHSSLAYLGYLAGCVTVADAMAEPALAAHVAALMDDEVTPTLRVPAGADVTAYKASLVERFRNPALKHRTWQIAMDGSQKLPQRLLGTVRDRLAAGAPIPRLALGIAAWMRYVGGTDEAGRPIDVRDPLAADLKARVERGGGDPDRIVDGMLQLEAVFGTDLPRHPGFRAAVSGALAQLLRSGVLATLRRSLAQA